MTIIHSEESRRQQKSLLEKNTRPWPIESIQDNQREMWKELQFGMHFDFFFDPLSLQLTVSIHPNDKCSTKEAPTITDITPI